MSDAPADSVTRTPLIAGNWKMNGFKGEGETLAAAIADDAGALDNNACEILICPPVTLLSRVRETIAGRTMLGAQDCAIEQSGAFTGDISAEMLADVGCSHVIVGHSERRINHQDHDKIVRAKAEAAHRARLTAIICIGETEAEREAGVLREVLARQLTGSLPPEATPENTVIAYEPVWAIGTGKVASEEDILAVHAFIREGLLALKGPTGEGFRILYGGSVKPDNAAEILALDNVDGALVGGASLNADDFWAIIEACTGLEA
jgi:triosephosphate isomerase